MLTVTRNTPHGWQVHCNAFLATGVAKMQPNGRRNRFPAFHVTSSQIAYLFIFTPLLNPHHNGKPRHNAMTMATISLILGFIALVRCQSFNRLQSYTGLDFFNRAFTLYEGYDPTFGYVDYVDLATAEQYGLVNLTEVGNTGIARWGVDTVGILDPNANLGRKSIRLQSVETYTHGLFVLDVKHLPASM